MSRIVVKRGVLAVLTLVAAVLIVPLTLGWLLTRPVPVTIGPPPPELNATTVVFSSASGSLIHAWWCRGPNSKAVVLLLAGVRANRLSMVGRAKFLRRAGYAVLLMDFQATGESPGNGITFGALESRDVLAAVEFIHTHAPNERVAIIGSSLGGAAALLATPPLEVDALVLEAVYPTIERATNNRLRNYLGPLGPFCRPLLLWQLPLRIGVTAEQLRPVDHIALSRVPIFIINGLDDRRTTPEDALLLFSIVSSPKQLWLVPHAGHVDLHRAAGLEYERRVLSFLSAVAIRGTATQK